MGESIRLVPRSDRARAVHGRTDKSDGLRCAAWVVPPQLYDARPRPATARSANDISSTIASALSEGAAEVVGERLQQIGQRRAFAGAQVGLDRHTGDQRVPL